MRDDQEVEIRWWRKNTQAKAYMKKTLMEQGQKKKENMKSKELEVFQGEGYARANFVGR